MASLDQVLMLSPDPNPGKGPGEPRTISEAIRHGEDAWRIRWQQFAKQWSQPALMKLAEATLGEKAIHSGQIGHFASQPAPKVLLSVGQLNLALAYRHGAMKEEPEYTIPATLEPDLWRDKRWLVMPDGAPMGPIDVFRCLIGQL